MISMSFWVTCEVCEDSTDDTKPNPMEALEYAERGGWKVNKDRKSPTFGWAICDYCRSWMDNDELGEPLIPEVPRISTGRTPIETVNVSDDYV